METRHDRRETSVRSSSQIEIVIPVAQREAAGFLTQAEEQTWKVRTSANCNDDVLSIAVQLKIDVRSGDRILHQRQPRFILQRHVEQLLRRWRSLNQRQEQRDVRQYHHAGFLSPL